MINTNDLPFVYASIAISIAKNMTADELDVFGSLIVAIGTELIAAAASKAAEHGSIAALN